MEKLRDYFQHTEGTGVLATSNFSGMVDAAVYERPNFIDDETVAFIMPDRLSHKDLDSNPHAAYLFVESGSKSKGTRLYLTKIREEKDSRTIDKLLEQKQYSIPGDTGDTPLFLVYFHIDHTRDLIQDGEQP